jgi:hypothetical protein
MCGHSNVREMRLPCFAKAKPAIYSHDFKCLPVTRFDTTQRRIP